jgi:hypothetical protein
MQMVYRVGGCAKTKAMACEWLSQITSAESIESAVAGGVTPGSSMIVKILDKSESELAGK